MAIPYLLLKHLKTKLWKYLKMYRTNDSISRSTQRETFGCIFPKAPKSVIDEDTRFLKLLLNFYAIIVALFVLLIGLNDKQRLLLLLLLLLLLWRNDGLYCWLLLPIKYSFFLCEVAKYFKWKFLLYFAAHSWRNATIHFLILNLVHLSIWSHLTIWIFFIVLET